MKHLYILRHAQSMANKTHKVVGSQDSPLSDLGRRQAEIAGQTIKKHLNFDVIISSPLSRALETAQIVAKQIELNPKQIIALPDLRERDLGEMEGADYNEIIRYEYDGNYEDVENALGLEPIEDFFARAQKVLQIVKQRPEDNILLVCHNGIGRMLRAASKDGNPLDLYAEPRIENAAIYKLV